MTLPLPSNYSSAHLIISPHLDDGLFSCGGDIHRLTQAGERVLVLTVMAGIPSSAPLSPLGKKLHRAWGYPTPESLIKARLKEDRAALNTLGAEHHHWPILDALYRRSPTLGTPLYPKFKALIGDIHPEDRTLLEAVTAAFRALGPVASIRAPLGLGGHVDHQLVHRGARAAFGDRCRFYEDFPYAQAQVHALKALEAEGWMSEIRALREEDIQKRLAGIRAYASQVPSFWPQASALDSALRGWIQQRGGEVLWSPPGASP